MRKIKCQLCDRIFYATKAVCYCDECRADAKAAGFYAERTCETCGMSYTGYPKSVYCPSCMDKRKRIQKKEYQERTKAGTARTIGSTDICRTCGEEFIVNSGRQLYCKKCAEAAIKQVSREKARARYYANKERYKERKKKLLENRKVCRVCEKKIAGRSSYCSEECRKIGRSMSSARSNYRRGARNTEYGAVKFNGKPKSGIPGIAWHQGKWQVQKRNHYIGIYDTVEEAKKALEQYKTEAEKELIKR